jgi:hypothetical protein
MTTILQIFLRALFGKDERIFTFLAWGIVLLIAGLVLTVTLIILILTI